jgi:uncharacterized repeat protein (TIGR02543 family)
MNRAIGTRRGCHLARAGIFLLVAGMAGCPAAPTIYCQLATSSTEGGSVTAPGQGTFIYLSGEVVNLVAAAAAGYEFVNWTGDVAGLASASAAVTTVTMNGDYSITANFEKLTAEVAAVWDWYDLDRIRDNLSGRYILMNNLDATTPGYREVASASANDGRGWEPIGGSALEATGYAFDGILDGQGYEIREAFISRPDRRGVGLIDSIGEAGVVKDLGVAGVEVVGACYVGGLAGFNEGGLVSGCYVSGSVSGGNDAGGLVGDNYGGATVSNCYCTGSVAGGQSVGGLIGVNSGDIVANSYSAGSVTGDVYVGGLIGRNRPTRLGLPAPAVTACLWDSEAAGCEESDAGLGGTTAQMQDVHTFSRIWWDIVVVAPGDTNPAYIWNIVDGQTYPFLSWQPVS